MATVTHCFIVHELCPRVEHSKIPSTLRQAQGERDFGMLNCGF